jgi:hypothetical protein
MAQTSAWPALGTLTIKFSVSQINEQPRLGWQYSADPELDPRHAITLLRDVADELEIDLPADGS